MAENAPLKLPINLILLDGVGTVMLVLGAMEYFTGMEFCQPVSALSTEASSSWWWGFC